MDMSTPGNSMYGLHMDQDEINAMLKPVDGSAILVLEWLKSFGVTVSQAQELLKTQYNVYRNTANSKTIIRTQSYGLPSILFDHVDLIQPTTMFGMKSHASTIVNGGIAQQGPSGVTSSKVTNCNKTATIPCIQELYKTLTFGTGSNSVKIGVAGFLEEFANKADLQIFCKKYRLACVGSSYTTIQLDGGGNNQSKPGIEADLDVQIVSALAFPNPVTFYSVGAYDSTDNQYKLWRRRANSTEDYATKVCNCFAQLGARGTSVLVSSGDLGVEQGPTNDGTGRVRFNPMFPASCPFVTAVGGTRYISPEQGVYFSGGGFSNYFAQPSYQTNAVLQFLRGLGMEYDGLFNKTGRGFPDVAAQSVNCFIVQGGKDVPASGTSCSAPIFAAIISIINDHRAAHDKPSLEFLNPWL
ncbi:hypothetical protein BGX26_000993 [Mortierella sp. AD094]|nr:hypothetical protein BGX26_000993 [Mortierella sp. AD094]